MPLTSDETRLFSSLVSTPYWSSAVAVQTHPRDAYLQYPFEPRGEPVAFLRLFQDSNLATAWQWGKIESAARAKELLASTITLVQAAAGFSPSNVDAKDVKSVRSWDYFAHFTGKDLASGKAYEAFNRLQGAKKTYWASGLNGFETVEFAVRAGKDLVESFF